MAIRSTKTAVAYGTENPVLYGADGSLVPQIDPLVLKKLVNFIFGQTNDGKNEDLKTKLSKSVVSEEGALTFVYDDNTKSGVVMKAGKLVSSKILNIEKARKVADNDNKGDVITVSYLDADKSTKTLTFDTISSSEVESLISDLNIDTVNSSISDISTRLSNVSTNVKDVSSWVQAIQTASYASNITKAENSPIIVTPTTVANGNGQKTYTIGVDVDNVTVKVNDQNKLSATGNTYKIVEGTTTEGYLKTYVLQQTDAAGTVTTIDGTIDIPKDQVLKSVHLCKVDEFETLEDGSSKPKNEVLSTATGYADAAGEIYLHFSWHLAGDTGVTSETYIKVTDIAPIYSGDDEYISISDDNKVIFDSSQFTEDKIGHIYLDAIGTEGEEGYVPSKEATGIYKIIEDNEFLTLQALALMDTSIDILNTSVSAIETSLQTLIDTDYTSTATVKKEKGTGYIDASVVIAEGADGKLTNTGSSIEINLTTGDAVYTPATDTDSAKLEAPETAGLMTTDSIASIKNYVDAVAAANQEGLTVLVQTGDEAATKNTAIAEVDADDDHKLTLKATKLGDVNITKNEENGTWEVNSDTYASSGIALAADVASEIISNELVVAAALNDINTRFTWVEI